MEKQILEELKQIKIAIAILAGTSHLPPQEQLSATVLDKAAEKFKKLSKMSDNWISEYDLSDYFKGVYNGIGKFIREEFGFANYFKHGKSHYYNKAAIQDLAKELKTRNVKLSRYIELKADQENLKKRIATAALNKKASKGKRDYTLPNDLYDINTTPHPVPAVELVKEDLKQLQVEFFEFKLGDYIDIYKGTHALVKFDYHYKKYISPELKQRCRKWCENFNYANNAFELITQKKNNFIPVKDDDMIQL